MSIDLHTHTNASDSNLSRKQLLDFCALRGIETVAITDHDTMNSSYPFYGDPVNVISGCELSAYDYEIGEKVHILCYLPKNAAHLKPYFDYMREQRLRAGIEIIEKIRRIYPVVTYERVAGYCGYSDTVFKQHIMNVLIEYGHTRELYGSLYRQLFNHRDGVCYVRIRYASVYQVIEMAREARGVIVLAHPSVYRNMPLVPVLARYRLIDGIEVEHPRNTYYDRIVLEQVCRDYSLLKTGGSDYHAANGTAMIGECTTDTMSLDRLYKLSYGK